MLLPISDFSGQSDVTEYNLTIFKNLLKYHGVTKIPMNRKSRSGEKEKKEVRKRDFTLWSWQKCFVSLIDRFMFTWQRDY